MKFSSTQCNLPKSMGDLVLAFGKTIPDNLLAEDGREKEPHITLKYGIHDEGPRAAEKALEGERPIKGRITISSIFAASKEHPSYDVLKLAVISPDLRRLNKKISKALPHTDTFSYNPHCTVAYLKPGEGKKFAGRMIKGLSGKQITFDTVIFSPNIGARTEIPLKAARK